MPRTIRIPRRDVGGGPATVLPSVEAAAAPARAAAGVGQAITGGIADVADTVIRAGEARQRKQDALTYVSELASSTTQVGEGLAAADAELNRMALAPDFDEQAWLAERERRYREVYGPIISGLRSDELRARRQGELDGILASDTGAIVDRLRGARAERSIEQVAEEGLRFARNTPLGAMPDFVGAVNETLSRTTEQFPELAGKAQEARDRILRGIRGSYLDRGPQGDLQFWTDVRAGDLDALGEETLLGVRAQARDQSLGVADEILDRAIRDQPEGVLRESGGLFPALDFTPDLTDIDAAIESTNALPEDQREEIQRPLRQARAALERQVDLYQSVAYPFWNEGGMLPHLDEDGARRGAVDDYFVKAVRPWLDDPNVPMGDKVNLLVRSIRGIGFLTPAMGAWVDETMLSASASPTTKMAIAQALGSVGPEPLRSMRALTQGQELALQERGLRPVVLEDRPPEVQAIIDGLGRKTARDDVEAANALQGVLDDQAAGRGAGGSRARSVGGPGGQDALQRVFAPDISTAADVRARTIQEEVVKGIRKSLKAMGVELDDDEITPRMQSEIGLSLARDIEDAQARGRTEQEAITEAKDKAFKSFVEQNPPVTIFGKTYLDGRLHATLQGNKYPPAMIEMTVTEALRERGYDVTKGDLLSRVRLYGGPFDLLADDEFKVEILADKNGEGGEILDGTLRIDGSEYDRWKNTLRSVGLEKTLGGATRQKDVERSRGELIEAWLMDPEQLRLWADPMSGEPSIFTQAGDIAALGGREIWDRLSGQSTTPEWLARELSRDRAEIDLPETDAPHFMRVPSLRKVYEETFATKFKGLDAQRRELLTQQNRRLDFRDYVPSESEVQGAAEAAARRAVRDILDQEFRGSSPEEILRSLKNGRLPSERGPDPALRPVRGAVP